MQSIHEVDESLSHIRKLPGFDGFQLQPSADVLTLMAAEGPIVNFNTTKFKIDAMLVTRTRITSLLLPMLIFSEVIDEMEKFTGFMTGKRSTYPSRKKEAGKPLARLWEAAVEPVCEELGHATIDDSELSRVWWIGVGPLAMAPFHAAGDRSRGSTRNTFCQAISPSIPTIKAVSDARQKKLGLGLGLDSRLLLITMPITPDTPAIPTIPAHPGTPAIPRTPAIPSTSTTLAIPRLTGLPP